MSDDVPIAYAELHCLSDFSFGRGASSAEDLFTRAKALGYRALAITDECTMAGIVRALKASEDIGLPLLAGTEVTLDDGLKLVLLAQTHAGYRAICRLIHVGRRPPDKGSFRTARGSLASGLAGTLGDHGRPWPLGRTSVGLLMAQLGLLAGYAIVLMATLLVDHRRVDTALLRARGAGSIHVAALSLVEAIVFAATATAVGPLLAGAAVGVFNVVGPLAVGGQPDERARAVRSHPGPPRP